MSGTPALPVLLTRIDASRNMARYYRLDVQPSLFGEWGVVREWGRIGRGGQRRTDWYGTVEDAVKAMSDLLCTKKHRGYRGYEGHFHF